MMVNDIHSIIDTQLNDCWNSKSPVEKNSILADVSDDYGAEELVNWFASNHWDDIVSVGKLIEDDTNGIFDYVIRPQNKKLTIAAYYCRISNGGAERVVSSLCNLWSSLSDVNGDYKYNVVLITDNGPLDNEYYLESRVSRAYIPAFNTSVKDEYANRNRAWQKVINEYDIDIVVHSQWLVKTTYFDMLSIKSHPKHPACVIHSHGICGYPFMRDRESAMEMKWKYKIADAAVALSECDELYIRTYNDKAKYIVNPISFNPLKTPCSSYEKNHILWCGRLSHQKQPYDLIEVMKFVVEKLPEAKLTIVGAENENILNRMKQLVDDYNLEDNVIFEGFSLDVSKYYAKAACLIITSAFEGFPLVIGEAMAHSLPVVSYDMPYLTYFRNGKGIISVKQNDCYNMAMEVVELLQNEDKIRQLGKAAKENIISVAECDIEHAWIELFNSINTKSEPTEMDSVGICFDTITEFQNIGRTKEIDALLYTQKQLQKEIRDLKKQLKKANKQIETIQKGKPNFARRVLRKIRKLMHWG